MKLSRLIDAVAPLAITLLIVAVLVGVPIGVECALASWKCSRQWADSGRRSTWRPLAGCLVEVDGRWVPAQAFRSIP